MCSHVESSAKHRSLVMTLCLSRGRVSALNALLLVEITHGADEDDWR